MRSDKKIEKGLEPWRFNAIYILLGLILVVYVIRLFSLQIINGKDYLAQSEENRLTGVSVSTTRGNIYDRNGTVLAQNVASFDVVITPAYLPTDPGTMEDVFRQLSELIDVPVTNGVINDTTVKYFTPCQTDFGIKEIYYIGDTNEPFSPVKVKCNVSQEIAMTIREKENEWQGVGVAVQQVRQYPTGNLTSEVVGFLGPITAEDEDYYVDRGFVAGTDKIGFAGTERELNDILMGKNGTRLIEVDNAGKEIRDVEPPVEAVPGNSVTLTIDSRLQSAARTALIAEIEYWNTYLGRIQSQNGVVIAMNPKTGEILAMVSYPNYENNRLERLIPEYYYNQLSQDPLKPMLNYAIAAEQPPGSVYKIVAAIGALNEKVVTPEQQLECPGTISVIQKFSPNDPGTPRLYYSYDREGHGICDFLKGFRLSDDVYFYKIGGGFNEEVPGTGLGADRLAEYAKALGFDRYTGIELPGEVQGLIPDPTWKRIYRAENWSTGDTYITTIGQGYVLATPLQVLQSFAILANDGKYMQPTIIKDVLDSQGNVIKPFEPTLVWDITKDPLINELDDNNKPTGTKYTVEPWVVDKVKEAMRLVVVDGTATKAFPNEEIPSAGKTGTAEYCDNVAQLKDLCKPENWPTHSWYVGYAPYDDPEIAVVAFVYNGGEGASVAAPIVGKVLEAYFELKAIDSASGSNSTSTTLP
ncbi:MAG TPA: penicillin-binding protein 2 [Anaerolineaceae bacterium]|nr:penicillin-binding protein 2 [Anaerolineaceae bacterium]